MRRTRIAMLDGYRSLAILLVMLFHFFSRYLPPHEKVSLYPYGDAYDYFAFGYYGVPFFFIISGFVILYTMEITGQFLDFWKKRLIRLVPSLLVACLLIYFFLKAFDRQQLFAASNHWKNILVNATLISPALFNKLLPGLAPFNFINGSFWSLWPEVQFYVFASLVYYLNKQRFFRNFLLLAFLVIAAHWLFIATKKTAFAKLPAVVPFYRFYAYWCIRMFSLPQHLPFFSLGVLFYRLFRERAGSGVAQRTKLFLFALCGFVLYSARSWSECTIYAVMMLLFFGFIYAPERLRFFNHPLLTRAGVCSYFLYLIHEPIGLLLIRAGGSFFQPAGFLLPLFLIVGFASISILYTERIDKPVSLFLKLLLFRKPVSGPTHPLVERSAGSREEFQPQPFVRKRVLTQNG